MASAFDQWTTADARRPMLKQPDEKNEEKERKKIPFCYW